MPKRIAVDSGPLIALFDKDDRHHYRAVEFIKEFTGELVTNFAVVTEVTHLLDFSVRAQTDFLQWALDGGVSIVDISSEDLRYIIELVQKYSDLPVDFADATLIALCERLKIGEVASVDKHFTIYRTRGKKSFRNVFFK